MQGDEDVKARNAEDGFLVWSHVLEEMVARRVVRDLRATAGSSALLHASCSALVLQLLFYESALLTEREHLEALGGWLAEVEVGNAPRLLFRASRDGFLATEFHRLCDNKGPTVTVVCSANGSLFGGFASGPWKSNNIFEDYTGCFIFTLVNPHGIPPTKYLYVARHTVV